MNIVLPKGETPIRPTNVQKPAKLKVGCILFDTNTFLHTSGGVCYTLRQMKKRINTVLSQIESDTVVFGFDIGASEYRNKLLPGYKGHRGPRSICIGVLARDLLNEHNNTFGLKGVEFDDIACSFSKKIKDLMIVTIDSDLYQLVSPTTSIYDHKRHMIINHENFKDTPIGGICFNHPKQYINAKVLAGDRADNIDGIPKIGMKKALKKLKDMDVDFLEEHEELRVRNEKLINLHLSNSEIIKGEQLNTLNEYLKNLNKK